MPIRGPGLVLIASLMLAACSRSGEPRQPADEPEAADAPTGITAREGYQARGAAVEDASNATVADDPATSPPADAPTSPGAMAAPIPPPASAYTCAGGGSLSFGQDTVSVQLADGRRIELPRKTDAPDETFANEALVVRRTAAGVELMQDEGGRSSCTVS